MPFEEQFSDFDGWRVTNLRAAGHVVRGDARIYYEEFGSPTAPPLLALHPAFGATKTMCAQIKAHAKDHRVVAIDNRGHGRSSFGSTQLSYEIFGEDVLAVMDELGISRARLVGWSDGGIIGLYLAWRHPERVECVVAMGANVAPEGAIADFRRSFAELDHDDPVTSLSADLYRAAAPEPARWPELFAEVKRLILNEPKWSWEDVARARSPVLLINGECDLIRPDHARMIRDSISGARLVVIPGADHNGPLTHAAAINEATASFLAGRAV